MKIFLTFFSFLSFLKGVVSKDSLRSEATNPKKKGNLDFCDIVSKYMMKKHYKIIENKGNPTVGLAARILDIAPFVVVVEEYVNGNNNGPGKYKSFRKRDLSRLLFFVVNPQITSPTLERKGVSEFW